MFDCAHCPASTRLERRCPLAPLEWDDLEEEGVRFEHADDPALLRALLLEQDRAAGDAWSDETRSLVRELCEQLQIRHLTERATGVPFGDPHPDLCRWYALLHHDAPEIVELLQEVRFDDQGRHYMWTPGAQWDQPALLLDAADILRAEHARVTREQMPPPPARPDRGDESSS